MCSKLHLPEDIINLNESILCLGGEEGKGVCVCVWGVWELITVHVNRHIPTDAPPPPPPPWKIWLGNHQADGPFGILSQMWWYVILKMSDVVHDVECPFLIDSVLYVVNLSRYT